MRPMKGAMVGTETASTTAPVTSTVLQGQKKREKRVIKEFLHLLHHVDLPQHIVNNQGTLGALLLNGIPANLQAHIKLQSKCAVDSK